MSRCPRRRRHHRSGSAAEEREEPSSQCLESTGGGEPPQENKLVYTLGGQGASAAMPRGAIMNEQEEDTMGTSGRPTALAPRPQQPAPH